MSNSGVILKGIGGIYAVKTDECVIECKVRGIFRKDNITPMVGDLVEINLPQTPDDEGNIIKIKERKNMLIRPPVSNIDQVVVVISITNPEPNLLLADKLLVTLESKRIDSVVCINKIDLDDESANNLSKIYKDIGYKVITVSAKQGVGIEQFEDILKGKTTAFAGNSGVGKSSILNAVNSEFTLQTGDISQKIGRGKHTTRHVELLALRQGGFVLDTPGFSSFELDNIKKEEIKSYFPELDRFTDACRFKTCMHISEPNCSVKDAVLDGTISKSRYDNYLELYKTISEINIYKN